MGTIERSKENLDSLIDGARDAVAGAADRAERGVESAAYRAVKSARVAGDAVRTGAETASKRAHRGVESAATALDHGVTRARADLSRATSTVTDYTVENPGRAILVAASAGFALGLLLSRRQSSGLRSD